MDGKQSKIVRLESFQLEPLQIGEVRNGTFNIHLVVNDDQKGFSVYHHGRLAHQMSIDVQAFAIVDVKIKSEYV